MGRYYIVEPNDHKEYSIVFRLVDGVNEVDIPENISDFRDEVEKFQVLLEFIFQDNDELLSKYYIQLIKIAQAGAGVIDPHPIEAMKDIKNLKKKIEEIYIEPMKFNKYMFVGKISIVFLIIIFFFSRLSICYIFHQDTFLFEYPYVLLGTYIGMNLMNFLIPINLKLENVIKWSVDNKLIYKDIITTTLISLVLYIFVKIKLFDITILGKSLYSLLYSEQYPEWFLVVFGIITGLLNKSLFSTLRLKLEDDLDSIK